MKIQIISDTCAPLLEDYIYDATLSSVWNRYEKRLEQCYLIENYYIIPMSKAIITETDEENHD